ncbi:MAG: MmcQ/YjbR family DNA-binding protein [Bacteriovoracaceae bacterium]
MIDLDSVRNYCLSKQGKITEEFPFDDEVLVFKLFGKIFLLTNVNNVPFSMNLKCDPQRTIELRERYAAVQPGYHMNKKMWNTVVADGSLPSHLLFELIDHSYNEVAKKLPKKFREKTVGRIEKKKQKGGRMLRKK